jgi:hypothetical protein
MAKVAKVVCMCMFRILVELSVLRIGTKGELHVSGSESISVPRTRATPHKDVMVWFGELGYRTGVRPRNPWQRIYEKEEALLSLIDLGTSGTNVASSRACE